MSQFGKGVSENEGKRVGGSDFAGMPKEVNMSQYPKNRGAGHRDLNDTMTGIDMNISKSESYTQKHLSNQH